MSTNRDHSRDPTISRAGTGGILLPYVFPRQQRILDHNQRERNDISNSSTGSGEVQQVLPPIARQLGVAGEISQPGYRGSDPNPPVLLPRGLCPDGRTIRQRAYASEDPELGPQHDYH
jgi:hypothetical protein